MYRVAILGFGPVARTAAEILGGTEWADITVLTEADEFAGRRVKEVYDEREGRWAEIFSRSAKPCPSGIEGMVFESIDVDYIASRADVAISALPEGIAGRVESAIADRGVLVSTHSSDLRWSDALIVPGANADRIHGVGLERPLVCSPNCTTHPIASLMKALISCNYGISSLSLETDQAISGKGDAATNPDYVEMMRNLGSFVDWGQGYANLNSEEWVTVCETWRMLGMVDTIEEAREQYDRVRKGEPASVTPIYAVTRRTSRDVGHILRLELTFEHAVNLGKIRQTASEYKLTGKAAAIPSSPERLFVDADGMPDPEKHSFTGMGMSYVVGGWKQEAPNLITVYALVNNLYGGAAGNAIQNAELWLEANHDAFTRPIA